MQMQALDREQAEERIYCEIVLTKAELAKRSLHTFLKEFWEELSEDPFSDNWHIAKICNELEEIFWRVAKRQPKEHDLVINIPPGTTKSTIVMRMFPVWAWLNAPWMSFITGSYDMNLALELADHSRDLINSPKFGEWYPWLKLRQDRDQKSKYQIMYENDDGVWKHGGKRYSTSVGGGVTGFHGHMILVDDPIDPKKAETSTDINRNAANNWMNRTLSTRKADKKNTPTVLIMQRLHEDDPSGNMLRKKKKKPVRHVRLPGRLSKDPNSQVMPLAWQLHYKRGLLDPDRLGEETLHEMEADLGQYGFAGQVQQSPTPPGGGMFKPDNMVVLNEMPNPINAKKKVYYWDKAGTAGGGAYTAGVCMWEMRKGRFPHRYVIIRVVRGQWGSGDREKRIKAEAWAAEKGTLHVVEQEGGSGGKESAENTVLNLAGLRVRTDSPTGDKILRADPLSVQVNWGNVAIVNGPWVKDFTDELRFWPLARFLDQGDAAAGAFNILRKAKSAGGWSGRRVA